MLSKRRVVKFKEETTAGTHVDGDTLILAIDPKFNLEFEAHERNIYDGSFGQLKNVIGKQPATLTFRAEVGGTGSAYTATTDAPAWAQLLDYCGFSAAFDTDHITYTPTSSDTKTLSMDLYIDGFEVKFQGCVGNAKFSAQNGDIIYVDYEFKGVYAGVAAASLPTTSGVTFYPNQLLSATVTIDGSSTEPINSFELDMGNNVAIKTDPTKSTGLLYAQIIDRTPNGKIDPLADTSGTFITKWLNSTEFALVVGSGSGSGKQVQFTINHATPSKVDDSDRDGFAVHDLSFMCAKSAGDDELTITLT